MKSKRPETLEEFILQRNLQNIALRGLVHDDISALFDEEYPEPKHFWRYCVALDQAWGNLFCAVSDSGSLELEIEIPQSVEFLIETLKEEYPDPKRYAEVYNRTVSTLALLCKRGLVSLLPEYAPTELEVLSWMYFKVNCMRALKYMRADSPPMPQQEDFPGTNGL